MPITLHTASHDETAMLVPVLHDAEEDDQRIRARLNDPVYTSYAALDAERLVGAATVRWHDDESEIEYIAVLPELRGHGYGKAIIAALLVEARQRGITSLLVGTANSSFDNIAFYQKCGFRMDHVRRDFFSYIQPPMSLNGILVLDMIVLRYTLVE